MRQAMSRTPMLTRWQQKLDGYRFRAVRADYCDYLGALLIGTKGGRTLRDVFAQDAARYGQTTVRGRLSARWLLAYQASGGDLYATWQHAFPPDELVLIRSAQAAGNEALLRTLIALSGMCRLIGKLRQIFASTLWSAGLAMLLLFLMLVAIPWWTAPRLIQTFSALPSEYYGNLTLSLLGFARFLHHYWVFALASGIAAWAWVLWSLPNLGGRLRTWLDRWGCWRLYRQVQALRLLSMLTILIGKRTEQAMRLRSAFGALSAGASPWMAARLSEIRLRLDAGQPATASLETGLLDREQFWFLADMIAANGLHHGLALAAERLGTDVHAMAKRQAQRLHWFLLLGALSCLLGLGLWHYAVIDELRVALMLFYASQ